MKLATILGTYQATLTKFPYLSKDWQHHCEEERLLGVSITGQWDCPIVRNDQILQKLKAQAIKTNKTYARRFNIKPAAAITCVKPSGTVSQVVDCSSGMHPRHAPYYIRRIRISATDSLIRSRVGRNTPFRSGIVTIRPFNFPETTRSFMQDGYSLTVKITWASISTTDPLRALMSTFLKAQGILFECKLSRNFTKSLYVDVARYR